MNHSPFYDKLKKIVEKEFPDTEDIKHLVCMRDGYSHIVWVMADWRRKEKCFRVNADRWCAWRVFDDRENLGLPEIKARIKCMRMMHGTRRPTYHL